MFKNFKGAESSVHMLTHAKLYLAVERFLNVIDDKTHVI